MEQVVLREMAGNWWKAHCAFSIFHVYIQVNMKRSCCDSSEISDYVLDLLSSGERDRVALHISRCSRCEQAAYAEARTVREIRLTIREVAQPAESRLRQLMPPIPDQGRLRLILLMRQQVAPLLALLAILLSSWFGQTGVEPMSEGSSTPPLIMTNAIVIQTAGSIQTASVTEQSALFTVAAEAPTPEEIMATPAPHPPPIEKLP